MSGKIFGELRARSDAAWANLTGQLQGMEACLERSDAPGEWTAREVLSHLLFDRSWDPVTFLHRFSTHDLPLYEEVHGEPYLVEELRVWSLAEFIEALAEQRRRVLEYLESLSDAEFQERKARIPFFKTFAGTEEISLQIFVGAFFDFHWSDHASQLAKIRKAAGLPAATAISVTSLAPH